MVSAGRLCGMSTGQHEWLVHSTPALGLVPHWAEPTAHFRSAAAELGFRLINCALASVASSDADMPHHRASLRGIKIPNPPQKNLFQGYDGNLTIGILPVSQFCSGHTMFVQRLGERLGLKPYAVHATFQFSGTPGKRNRMREFMMYDDPPEYYDHKVGFVSFDVSGGAGYGGRSHVGSSAAGALGMRPREQLWELNHSWVLCSAAGPLGTRPTRTCFGK